MKTFITMLILAGTLLFTHFASAQESLEIKCHVGFARGSNNLEDRARTYSVQLICLAHNNPSYGADFVAIAHVKANKVSTKFILAGDILLNKPPLTFKLSDINYGTIYEIDDTAVDFYDDTSLLPPLEETQNNLMPLQSLTLGDSAILNLMLIRLSDFSAGGYQITMDQSRGNVTISGEMGQHLLSFVKTGVVLASTSVHFTGDMAREIITRLQKSGVVFKTSNGELPGERIQLLSVTSDQVPFPDFCRITSQVGQEPIYECQIFVKIIKINHD